MTNPRSEMRSHAVDFTYRTSALVTRRSFLQATGLAFASRLTSIAGGILEWLTRWCLLASGIRFAGAA